MIIMHFLAPMIVENFKKLLKADPELWPSVIYWPQMAHLFWKKSSEEPLI